MEFKNVWSRIEANAGNPFRLKTGKEFTYGVSGGCVHPPTNRILARSQFERAWNRLPVSGPGELQDLQGPSYLYAILTDARIS